MMKCNDHSLEALLDADDDASGVRGVVQHVESCEHCQNRLGQLAAEADEWREARKWLSDADSADGQDDAERAWHRHPRRRATAWTEAMASKLLAPPSHPEMLGRIGRYEVERLIGAGGMGIVFKAFDSELNRPVAVKVLAPHLAGSGAARSRFAREARAAAAVVDEHVVAIHNVETDGESPFLVMQYVPGESLQTRIDRSGPLEVCEILRIGMQTAKGLAAAHAQGLIHRDVKPSNILVESSVDRALLTDFGLARAGDDASLTQTGYHPGTPQFMSPEQARGESVDQRSDLFSLGSVLYTMCTARTPFRAETSYGVLRRITDTDPRPIREINPDVPEWLCAIIAKLMAKGPEDRFDSAAEVADLLEDCLAHVQQPTTVPLPESARQLPVAELANSSDSAGVPKVSASFAIGRRSKWLTGLAAFCFAIVLAGIVIVLELNKGTLKIESDVDDVPIKIMQGDEVVENLTVTKDAAYVRIAAGRYVVEIGGGVDGLEVKNDIVNLQRGGQEVVRIVRRSRQEDGPRSSPAPAVSGLERFQGVWAMNTCDSLAAGFGDSQQVVWDWRWDFRGDEVVWSRSNGEVWKMKCRVDPTKTPHEIDITYLDGPHKGKKSLGMYRWGGIDNRTLEMNVQDPGADVPRPTSISWRSDGQTSLIFLERPDAAQELASMQGDWKFDIFYTDVLPKPRGKGDDRKWHLAPCVIKGKELSWIGSDGHPIRMSFTINPTKLPGEIDATFLSGSHKGEKCRGIYERRGSTLLLCLNDPGSQAPRPKTVSYETLKGRTMIVLVREKVPAKDTMPGTAPPEASHDQTNCPHRFSLSNV